MTTWLDDDAPIEVGDLLHGICGGAFAHYFGDKRVVGLGEDWVVAREENGVDEDNGVVLLFQGDPDELKEYR